MYNSWDNLQYNFSQESIKKWGHPQMTSLVYPTPRAKNS
jgi:hypothetical protein